jgi:hypothetical protein
VCGAFGMCWNEYCVCLVQLFFQIIIAEYIFWCERTAIGCQLREPWFCELLVVESVVDFMVSKRICKLFRKMFLLFLCYV